MLKAIIFDCFGVLYPVYIDDWFANNKTKFTVDTDTLDKLNLQIDLGQISQREFYEAISREIKLPVELIQNEIEQNIALDTKLISLIKKLKEKYAIGLLSNAGKEEIDIIYRDKIDGLFDALAISYEVKSVKPNTQIFLICLERLGAEAQEALFVDDNMTNIKAAQEIGLRTLYYPKFGNIPKDLTELARF